MLFPNNVRLCRSRKAQWPNFFFPSPHFLLLSKEFSLNLPRTINAPPKFAPIFREKKSAFITEVNMIFGKNRKSYTGPAGAKYENCESQTSKVPAKHHRGRKRIFHGKQRCRHLVASIINAVVIPSAASLSLTCQTWGHTGSVANNSGKQVSVLRQYLKFYSKQSARLLCL